MNIPTPQQINNELSRRSLKHYIKQLWTGYATSAHIDMLVEKLEAVERGEIKRLIIDFPPRHSKSVHVSEYLPAWFMGRNPSKQIIASSYSGDFAADWGGKVKEHIEDPITKAIFPELELKQGTKSKSHFETTKRGEYSAVGVGGSCTGRGADLFIIDDPIKNRRDAESSTIREAIKGWFKSTAYTRLMPGGAIIVMMTRWHMDDLVGWILRENKEKWDMLVLPAIAEESDMLGREEGEALWPSMFPIDVLETTRGVLGSYEFGALYQQHPTPIEGALFKLSWFPRYNALPDFPLAIIHSYDTGTKTGAENDPTSCGVWHVYSHGWYLAEVINDRINHPERVRMVKNMDIRDSPTAILIEDEGNGTSLIQDLRDDETCRHMNIIAISTKGKSKIVRSVSVTGTIESGRVHLPASAGWLPSFESELRTFPNGLHDDQVDQMTQAIAWMRENAIGIEPDIDDSPVQVAGMM